MVQEKRPMNKNHLQGSESAPNGNSFQWTENSFSGLRKSSQKGKITFRVQNKSQRSKLPFQTILSASTLFIVFVLYFSEFLMRKLKKPKEDPFLDRHRLNNTHQDKKSDNNNVITGFIL